VRHYSKTLKAEKGWGHCSNGIVPASARPQVHTPVPQYKNKLKSRNKPGKKIHLKALQVEWNKLKIENQGLML
jgi:hypothetical protein